MFRAKHKLVFIVYKGNSPPRESITFAQNSLSLSQGSIALEKAGSITMERFISDKNSRNPQSRKFHIVKDAILFQPKMFV